MSRTIRRKGFYKDGDYKVHTDHYNWRWKKTSFIKGRNNSLIRAYLKEEISNVMKYDNIDTLAYNALKKYRGYNYWRWE